MGPRGAPLAAAGSPSAHSQPRKEGALAPSRNAWSPGEHPRPHGARLPRRAARGRGPAQAPALPPWRRAQGGGAALAGPSEQQARAGGKGSPAARLPLSGGGLPAAAPGLWGRGVGCGGAEAGRVSAELRVGLSRSRCCARASGRGTDAAEPLPFARSGSPAPRPRPPAARRLLFLPAQPLPLTPASGDWFPLPPPLAFAAALHSQLLRLRRPRRSPGCLSLRRPPFRLGLQAALCPRDAASSRGLSPGNLLCREAPAKPLLMLRDPLCQCHSFEDVPAPPQTLSPPSSATRQPLVQHTCPAAFPVPTHICLLPDAWLPEVLSAPRAHRPGGEKASTGELVGKQKVISVGWMLGVWKGPDCQEFV